MPRCSLDPRYFGCLLGKQTTCAKFLLLKTLNPLYCKYMGCFRAPFVMYEFLTDFGWIPAKILTLYGHLSFYLGTCMKRSHNQKQWKVRDFSAFCGNYRSSVILKRCFFYLSGELWNLIYVQSKWQLMEGEISCKYLTCSSLLYSQLLNCCYCFSSGLKGPKSLSSWCIRLVTETLFTQYLEIQE